MEPESRHQDAQCCKTPLDPSCCAKCGGPTTIRTPPLSDMSPPPIYRPIRAPASNLPPNNHSQAIILAPVPQSQKVPMITPPFNFLLPSKRIQSPDDIRHFFDSDSAKNFLGFVVALSESIHGHKISDVCYESQTIDTLVSILNDLLHWIDEIPPAQQSARYGNLSYRAWHSRLKDNSESLMLRFLPTELQASVVEIVAYFNDSFGNSSRIDYGEYMYLSCIAFVKRVKRGLFAEHSPLLDDISGVPNWNKVNSGLLKMYKAEVLEKVPIMQHFLFGWLITWE